MRGPALFYRTASSSSTSSSSSSSSSSSCKPFFPVLLSSEMDPTEYDFLQLLSSLEAGSESGSVGHQEAHPLAKMRMIDREDHGLQQQQTYSDQQSDFLFESENYFSSSLSMNSAQNSDADGLSGVENASALNRSKARLAALSEPSSSFSAVVAPPGVHNRQMLSYGHPPCIPAHCGQTSGGAASSAVVAPPGVHNRHMLSYGHRPYIPAHCSQTSGGVTSSAVVAPPGSHNRHMLSYGHRPYITAHCSQTSGGAASSVVVAPPGGHNRHMLSYGHRPYILGHCSQTSGGAASSVVPLFDFDTMPGSSHSFDLVSGGHHYAGQSLQSHPLTVVSTMPLNVWNGNSSVYPGNSEFHGSHHSGPGQHLSVVSGGSSSLVGIEEKIGQLAISNGYGQHQPMQLPERKCVNCPNEQRRKYRLTNGVLRCSACNDYLDKYKIERPEYLFHGVVHSRPRTKKAVTGPKRLSHNPLKSSSKKNHPSGRH
ncbi:hypothetical protein BV898_10537 [Hypsibius exemplaris]|uniref:Uncharacterized protein n=1 Tax=Hypsibius exemplaris TaxID=2072580 RepID=A0A1W0WJD3_HYPEX|nr:hypothetical protein BV898_10537 [Hypsibius exemplaris]